MLQKNPTALAWVLPLAISLFPAICLAAGSPTSIALTASSPTAIFGQPVTLTASVTPATATGKVTFYDGAAVVGTTALSNGAATLTTGLLPSGPRSLKAYYSGDGSNAPAASAAFSETVNQLPQTGFDSGVNYSASATGPVAIGDFNGDGKPDLAVLDQLFKVGILLNTGKGIYTPVVEFPLNAQYDTPGAGIAAADFNGDGKTDLVAIQNNTIYVFLGNGDGTFQAGGTRSVDINTLSSITIADFNADGKADIVVAGMNSGAAVFLGNGDGSFQTALPMNLGTLPAAIVAGDFNNDGKTDLAIAISDYGNLANANSVGIVLGNGDGSFQTPVFSSAGLHVRTLSIGDFNGDGKADLVTANYSGSLSVFLGNGDGTLQKAVSQSTGNYPTSATVGDFDGDGHQDLFVINAGASGVPTGSVVSIFRGTGSGSFLPPVNYPVPSGSTTVTVAGLAGTGVVDMVLTGSGLVIERGLAPRGTASSAIAIASSLNPSVYGKSVTFTAAGTPSTATGAITFYDGAMVLGTSPLVAGVATLQTSLLSSGSHPVTTRYSGDVTLAASTSSTLAQNVSPVLASGFGTDVSLDLTNKPYGIEVGDFNGDGQPDVAVAASTGVNVLLGVSGGTFRTAVNYSVAGSSLTVAVGDFDGDGKQDLISGNTILFGNGDGTFRVSPVRVSGGSFVGDFNADEFADTAILANGGISIALGNGDGTFGSPAAYAENANSNAMTMGDFNGDGKADFAVANVKFDTTDEISVFLGNGDGTFAGARNFVLGMQSEKASGPVPLSLSAGDFDGDGTMDLVVSTIDTSVRRLQVLLGNGDGTFHAGVTLPGEPGLMKIADFNGDGRLDIALTTGAVSSLASYGIDIYFGNGNGTFQQVVHAVANYNATSSVQSFASADFNGDGRVDLVFVTSDSEVNQVHLNLALIPATVSLSSSVSPSLPNQPITLTATVLPAGTSGFVTFFSGTAILGSSPLTNGQAAFSVNRLPPGIQKLTATWSGDAFHAPASSSAITQTVSALPQNGVTAGNSYSISGPGAPVTGDFNRDGIPDLVVPGVSGFNYSLNMLVGNGDGTFQPPIAIPSPDGVGSLAVADFNGDGKLDFAAFGTSFRLYVGNGDGTFQSNLIQTQTNDSAPVVGDFNRDGIADLASQLRVQPGKGDGTFRVVPGYPTFVTSHSVATGDLNGDGIPDIILTNSDASISVLLGYGNGTFQNPINYATSGSPLMAAVGDFNGDGKLDLAIVVDSGSASTTIAILPGRGDGTFGTATSNPSARLPQSIAVADFNGDGIADLATANYYQNTVGLYYGRGDGTFQPAVNVPAGNGPGGFAVGDFNGDGRPDLAVSEFSSNTVQILLGLPVGPDLAIAESHTGTFSINQGGFTYTLTVSNAGNAASTGAVTVVDTLPAGLTATAIAGAGWTCVTANGTCTRSDALAPSAAWPAITVTVSVDGNAAANVVNSVAVSGGGDINPLNNVASDPTSISRVGQTPQTITFVSPDAQTGPGSFILSPTASSSLPVSLTSNTLLVCTVSGNIVSPASVGTCSITASQSGDPTYAAAVSVTQSFEIVTNAQGAAITLSSSGSPAGFGQAVTLTATVAPTAATGHVTFYDGVTPIGAGVLNNGKALLTTKLLSSGSRLLRAIYAGDLSYAPAKSPVVTQVVLAQSQNSFTPGSTWSSGGNPWTIAQGDFDGDGKIDLAVTNQAGTGAGASLLRGNGDGTFQAPVSIGSLQGATAIVASDFNGDGKTDLVVAGYAFAFAPSTVNLFLNNGDGTFAAPLVLYSYPVGVNSLSAADFNGDGNVDLAVGLQGSIVLLLNNGNNVFTSGVSGFNFAVLYETVEDFNADGKPDVAVSGGAYNSAAASVALGNGDRTLRTPVTYPGSGYHSASIVAGDFNGDGKPDIAATTYGSNTYDPGTLNIFLGKGDGTFQSAVFYPTGLYPGTPALGDVNGDGIPDIVLPNKFDNNVGVFLGVGDGTFLAQVTHSVGKSPVGVIIGDFNGDGGADLAVANSDDNNVTILLGKVAPTQTITFAPLPDVTFGISPFTLTATSSSGLPVTFSTATITVCTVSDTSVTIVGAGTCAITARQQGNADFGSAPPVLNTFTVDKSSQTITFAPISDTVFNLVVKVAPGLSASANTGLPVTFSSNTPLVCDVTVLIAAGTCSITATQTGNANYYAAPPVTRTYTIAKGPQNINFPAPSGYTFGGPFTLAPLTLAAVAQSGLPVTFVSNTPEICTVQGSALTLVSIGDCSLTASQAGDSNFLPATSQVTTFNIRKGFQAITFNAPGAITLPTSTATLTATASSTLTVQFASTTTSVCTVTETTVTALTAGTCTITASQPGNANFLAAPAVTRSFNINPVLPSTPGIFRQNFLFALDSNGNHQIDGTGAGQDIIIFNFVPAKPGDKPVAGDWNGDGKTKIGIYRPASGQWFLDYNGNGVFDAGDKTYNFGGIPTDLPVTGDWNGDGRTKVGLFRDGFLWILDFDGDGAIGGSDQVFGYGGIAGDVPVVGDWNGDGRTKVGVVRPFFPGTTPAFWILDANNDHSIGAGDLIFGFGGITGDVPIAGDWNASGTSKAGVYRQGFFWVLDNNGSAPFVLGSSQVVAFAFGGIAGDIPLSGKW